MLDCHAGDSVAGDESPFHHLPKAGKIIHSHLLQNRFFIEHDFPVTQSYCMCLTLLWVVILKTK